MYFVPFWGAPNSPPQHGFKLLLLDFTFTAACLTIGRQALTLLHQQ
ncbi:MAG: hypothetical protein LBP59_10280 [Planctomycetaceae bacterium]|nr:hypothetical protein [Planctomycetaceae bacterium]